MSELSPQPTSFEATLRDAGRQKRKVRMRVRYEAESGDTEYERSYEPYSIENGELVAFSLFRNEFRTIPLADISRVEVMPGEFRPRRPVDL